jgi:hypothetical protein
VVQEITMSKTVDAILLWVPRIAGIGVTLLMAVFALDDFSLMHLVPAFLVLGAVAIAWRFALAGAAAFVGLALIYAVSVHWRLDWIAVIGGPLVVVAALFAVSWRYRAAI